MVARLLTAGADVDAVDSSGQTALWKVSYHGHVAVVVALLGAGADASKATATGTTPLASALLQGHATGAARLRAA